MLPKKRGGEVNKTTSQFILMKIPEKELNACLTICITQCLVFIYEQGYIDP